MRKDRKLKILKKIFQAIKKSGVLKINLESKLVSNPKPHVKPYPDPATGAKIPSGQYERRTHGGEN